MPSTTSKSATGFTPSLPLSRSTNNPRKSTQHKPPSSTKTKTKTPSAQITTVLSDRQLTDLLTSTDRSSVVVLKCFASYCRGCKGVEPKYRKIAAAYEQAANTHTPPVRFCEMDYARNEQFCKDTLGVRSLPFFGIWKDGRYIGGEAIGWQNVAQRLVDRIETVSQSQPPSS